MGVRSRWALGVVLVAVGLGVNAVGIFGAVHRWDGSSARAARPATTTTTLPPEQPSAFLGSLAAALQGGDLSFLLGRLNPAVRQRFGEGQCLAALATATDPSAGFTVLAVSPPAPFAWTTGTGSTQQTTTVPDGITVQVTRTARGVTGPAVVHLAYVGSELTWFTDCSHPGGV